MEKFLERIKKRIYIKSIQDIFYCNWYYEDEEPLTKEEIEELFKKIETNYN